MLKSVIASAVIIGVTLGTAHAGDYNHFRPSKSPYSYKYEEPHPNLKHGQEYARVLSVTPITRTLSQQIPQKTCWDETVRYTEPSRGSATPAIIGGIIGATLGHSLGSDKYKTNRTIKTVALGALGASIGNDIGNQNRGHEVRYGTEQRCSVSYQTRYEEQVVAYDVSYRFRGKTYRTQMDYHPGKSIPVQVDVHPVF